jgi:hypothetical protein
MKLWLMIKAFFLLCTSMYHSDTSLIEAELRHHTHFTLFRCVCCKPTSGFCLTARLLLTEERRVLSFTRPEECNLPNDFGRTPILSVPSVHRRKLASNVWGGGGKTKRVYYESSQGVRLERGGRFVGTSPLPLHTFTSYHPHFFICPSSTQ